MIWDSNSGWDKRLRFLFRTSKPVQGPTQSPIHTVSGFPRGVKRREREVYLSPPNAEVQNEWSYTSALFEHLHDLKSYISFFIVQIPV